MGALQHRFNVAHSNAADDFSKLAGIHRALTDLQALLAHHSLRLPLLLAKDSLQARRKAEMAGKRKRERGRERDDGLFEHDGTSVC